nr:class I SAM-dependent methyltransferase [Oceanococcus sp. HetDA_MAG_MS8]
MFRAAALLWSRWVWRWRSGKISGRVAGYLGRSSIAQRVRWHGARGQEEGATALVQQVLQRLPPEAVNTGAWVLCSGPKDGFHRGVLIRLRANGLRVRETDIAAIATDTDDDLEKCRLVLCLFQDASRQTQLARAVMRHPFLSQLPFEYVAGLDAAQPFFSAHDEYRETFFVSPALLDKPTPHEIYAESLSLFEQKCGLRDFLDLYQLLKLVVERNIPGDIAEFGSYQGHSGWLIARTLELLGSDKRVFLFDTFDRFPQERGVDYFWGNTHHVDFSQVQKKFEKMPKVHLIQGDFTQTLDSAPIEKLAMAFIDCDSFRATEYLLRAIPQQYLSPGSVLVCEDYGHPALLGNRSAVHEVLDGQTDWLRLFLHFSGLYVSIWWPQSTSHSGERPEI